MINPISTFNNEMNFNNYFKQIDMLTAVLLTKAKFLLQKKTSNIIPSLNKFLKDECGYIIKPDEEFRVVQGILIGLMMIGCEGTFCI
jgi:hypothetical protein